MSHPGDGEKRGACRGREKGETTVSRERFPCHLAAAFSPGGQRRESTGSGFLPGGHEPVGRAIHIQDMGAVGQPVHKG